MAKATVAIIAVTSPTRNSMTTGMMKQNDGIVCSVSMIGVTMAATRSLREHQRPMGMPRAEATRADDAAEIERLHRRNPEPGRGAEAGQDSDDQRQPPAPKPPAQGGQDDQDTEPRQGLEVARSGFRKFNSTKTRKASMASKKLMVIQSTPAFQ